MIGLRRAFLTGFLLEAALSAPYLSREKACIHCRGLVSGRRYYYLICQAVSPSEIPANMSRTTREFISADDERAAKGS